MASFIKSPGHPINGEHEHAHNRLSHGTGIVTFCFFFPPVISRFIGFPALLPLISARGSVYYYTLCVIAAEESCQMSAVARREKLRRSLAARLGPQQHMAEKCSKQTPFKHFCYLQVFRKIQPMTVNPALSKPKTFDFNPLFSTDLLYKRIFLLKPQTINKLT